VSEEKTTIRLPLKTDAVLFDLDDTLHYRSKSFRGWAEWFAHTHLSEGDAEQIAALADYLVELDAHGYTPRELYFEQLRQKYPTLAILKDPIKELIASYQREVLKHLVRESEIWALLRTFKELGIPFGIVTNGVTTQQQRKIEVLELQEFTSCIFISEEFGVGKPDRAIFLAAARCLETPPERVLFVGDHPRNDIWGAHQTGMRTLWVQHPTREWPRDVARDIVDMTVGSLAELPGIFGVEALKRATPH
jgi:putative hydrolase of the HAD superfamily